MELLIVEVKKISTNTSNLKLNYPGITINNDDDNIQKAIDNNKDLVFLITNFDNMQRNFNEGILTNSKESVFIRKDIYDDIIKKNITECKIKYIDSCKESKNLKSTLIPYIVPLNINIEMFETCEKFIDDKDNIIPQKKIKESLIFLVDLKKTENVSDKIKEYINKLISDCINAQKNKKT
jgi:hypothetical protein